MKKADYENAYNDVVSLKKYSNGINEIKVCNLTGENLGLYETGMKAALAEIGRENYLKTLIDFSEVKDIKKMEQKDLFDVFHFISFHCMKDTEAYVQLSEELDWYVKNQKKIPGMWKLNDKTVQQIDEHTCSLESLEEKLNVVG